MTNPVKSNELTKHVKTLKKSSQYYSEVTPNGVKVYLLHNDNAYHEQEVIPFADVLTRADAGEWDDKRPLALRILAEWASVAANHTSQNLMIFYRWLVADAYVADLVELHGAEAFHGHHGNMETNRQIERLAMANNIEGTAISHFGVDEGARLTVQFYIEMLSVHEGAILGISAFGRETLNELHEGFLQAFITEGLPNEIHH
jgi:hypothetical protein